MGEMLPRIQTKIQTPIKSATITNAVSRILSLCMKGKVISHRRGQRRLHPKEALVRINRVDTTSAEENYVGNEVLLVKVYDNNSIFTKQGQRNAKITQDDEIKSLKLTTNTFTDKTEKVKLIKGRILKENAPKGVVVVRFDRNLAPVEMNLAVYVRMCRAEEYED